MRRRDGLLALAALAALPLPPVSAAARGVQPQPWPAGRRTSDFSLATAEGGSVMLSALRGKPVLLNFWASWCVPCRLELPSLELLATRHEAVGLQVLAINFRETDGALRRFIEDSGLTLPVLRDRDGAVAQAYGARVFPTTVAIARDGRARFFVVGEVDWSGPQARRWIEPIVSPQ